MTPFQAYRLMSWTTSRDECEADCGTIMEDGRYVEGDRGHYCSEACRDECEDEDCSMSDEEERAHERRQMGIT